MHYYDINIAFWGLPSSSLPISTWLIWTMSSTSAICIGSATQCAAVTRTHDGSGFASARAVVPMYFLLSCLGSCDWKKAGKEYEKIFLLYKFEKEKTKSYRSLKVLLICCNNIFLGSRHSGVKKITRHYFRSNKAKTLLTTDLFILIKSWVGLVKIEYLIIWYSGYADLQDNYLDI